VQAEPIETGTDVARHHHREDRGRPAENRIGALQIEIEAIREIRVSAGRAVALSTAAGVGEQLECQMLDQVGQRQTIGAAEVLGNRHLPGRARCDRQQCVEADAQAAVVVIEARGESQEGLLLDGAEAAGTAAKIGSEVERHADAAHSDPEQGIERFRGREGVVLERPDQDGGRWDLLMWDLLMLLARDANGAPGNRRPPLDLVLKSAAQLVGHALFLHVSQCSILRLS
jgi:hypothetical protein